MTRSEIKEKLREVLAMTDINPQYLAGEIEESKELVKDFGFSSVGMLYTVIGIEEMFGIRFEGVSMADFRTVGDVVDYIEKAKQ